MGNPWGCGKFTNTYKGIFKVSGAIPRSPGCYSLGGVTNEYIHKSVIERMNSIQYAPPDISKLSEDEFGELEKRLSW